MRGAKSKGRMWRGILAATLVGALTSCSAPTEPTEFDGPWAAEFQAHYDSAQNDFVRGVLQDGKITDQEFSEMLENFKTCLLAAKITIDYHSDGSYETTAPESLGNDASYAKTVECSQASGEDLIGSLHSFLSRNPQHLDEAEIMAECLVREGVLDAGYSAEDFARDSPAQSYPFKDEKLGAVAFESCNADPLGLFG